MNCLAVQCDLICGKKEPGRILNGAAVRAIRFLRIVMKKKRLPCGVWRIARFSIQYMTLIILQQGIKIISWLHVNHLQVHNIEITLSNLKDTLIFLISAPTDNEASGSLSSMYALIMYFNLDDV